MSEVILQNNMNLLKAEFDLRKTLLDIEKENAQRQLEKAKPRKLSKKLPKSYTNLLFSKPNSINKSQKLRLTLQSVS